MRLDPDLAFRLANGSALFGWLAPDTDEIPALSGERDALWARLQATAFLTDDEKRAAVGFGKKGAGGGEGAEGGGSKFSPDQPRAPAGTPDGGQWVGDGAGTSPQAFTLVWEEPDAGAQPPGGQTADPAPTPGPPEEPSNESAPVVAIADRPLTGRGHHMLTNKAARDIGNFPRMP